MRSFAQVPNTAQRAPSSKSSMTDCARLTPSRDVNTILTGAGERDAGITGTTSPSFSYDFGLIPVHSPAIEAIQAKLVINRPGDDYEREADRVAEQVVRMPAPRLQRACACGSGCSNCQTEQPAQEPRRLQTKRVGSGDLVQTQAPPIVHDVLRSPGEALDTRARAFFEPRFGYDFSRVRVHTGAQAAVSARSVGAYAYTVGSDIVFGDGKSTLNRSLLAHELAHVVQQTTAPPVLQRFADCASLLAQPDGAFVDEKRVQNSLARDARRIGKVEQELDVPGGSAAPWRTEPAPGRGDEVIVPQILSEVFNISGRADIAVLNGTALEVVEVKEASWISAVFAESQLLNYVDKGNRAIGEMQDIWRARGHRRDKIKSVRGMPTDRLNLPSAPRSIGGKRVSLAWCRNGVIVFKAAKDRRDREPVPVRVPEPVKAPVPVRMRVTGQHDGFDDYVNRLPDLEGLPGRDFIVAIEGGLYAQQVSEAMKQRMYSDTRIMRVDPRSVPFIQVEPVLIGGAMVAGVIGGAILLVALAPAVSMLAGAVAAKAAATVTAVMAATESGGAWVAAKLGQSAAATVVAHLVAGGMAEAEAAEAVKPLVGEPLFAMRDVTEMPELANPKPGLEVSVDGKTFNVIITLSTRQ